MIGFEYICRLFGVQYKDIADELGISKQTINSWTSRRRKIPKKHILSLSKRFNIPENYFQKEIDRTDELMIESIKFKNGVKEIKREYVETDRETGKKIYGFTTDIDIEDMIGLSKIDYENKKDKYIKNVEKSLDECFKHTNEYDDNGVAGLEDANELLEFYDDFFYLVNNPKVNKDTLKKILRAIKQCYIVKPLTTSDFEKDIINVIKKNDVKPKKD